MRSFFYKVCLLAGCVLASFSLTHKAQAVPIPCVVSSDAVIDQSYVTDNDCSLIQIEGNVSTTWMGLVELPGAGSVTIKSGYTMTMGLGSEMILGEDDDLIIEGTAILTHTAEDKNGIKITARNVTVAGILNASEKGCRAAGAAGDDGWGFNVSTMACEYRAGGYGRGGGGSGAGGGGGSHARSGGTGGWSTLGGSAIYGSAILPQYLGSGGGTGYYFTAFGGAGGGLIHVTSTGTLTVDGVIRANGGNGGYDGAYHGGGGGAGGSILLRAATLAGSGTVSVSGGDGGAGGGGGSGGRVAMYYGSLAGFSLSSVTAAGGAGGVSVGEPTAGGAGTTFFLDRFTDDGTGTVTITTGFDFPPEGDYTRQAYIVSSGAVLGATSTATLTVSSTAWLTLSGVTWSSSESISSIILGSDVGISTTSTSLAFSAATSLSIIAPTWENVTTSISMTKSGARSTFDIESNLTLRDFSYTGGGRGVVDGVGGFLIFPNNYSLSLVSSTLATSVSSTLLSNFTLDSRSTIDATGKGCAGSTTTDDGYGPESESSGRCAVAATGYGRAGNGGGGGGGGAAHAGAGGAAVGGGAAQNSIYGSSTLPFLPGSGGGGGYWQAPAAGGDGGGVISLIISGASTIDGQLLANGRNGLYGGSYNGGGGGSGGSIYLRTGSFSGGGVFSADGGNGGTVGGGGGGGGRIALAYSSKTFSGTSSTAAGTGGAGGATDGSVGSISLTQLNIAPDVPTLLGPASLVDGSTTGTNTPVFSFTLSDPDMADSVKYRIQIDDSLDFSGPVVDYISDLAAEGGATFQVGQAQGSGTYIAGTSGQTLSDTTYYWRVKTIDAAASESSYATANSGLAAFIVDTAVRQVEFESEALSGAESVTAASVRVVLSSTHFEDVSVTYSVVAASTTAEGAGTDYTLASGVATISAGQTSTTIPFTVVDDSIDEANETLVIALSSPVYAVIGSVGTTTYTLLDNDAAAVAVSTPSMSLAEGGASSTYTLVLGSQPTSTVRVTLTPSAQLTVNTTTLEFTSLNWSTPQTVTVNASQDALQEGAHSATVSHAVSVPSGFSYGYDAGLSVSDLTATIADDEVASIAVSTNALSVTEGGSGAFSIVLGTSPSSVVEIGIAAGSGMGVSTSSIQFTGSNYATPVTISVTPTDDSVFTGNRSSSVTLTVSTTALGYTALTLSNIAVSITEDERTGGGAIGGGSGGGSVTPVFLSPAPPVVSAPIIPTQPSVPEVITILNPSDVLSLVRATQGSRDFEREARVLGRLSQDFVEMRVTPTDAQRLALSNFVTYGISDRTYQLGEGERRALVRDALQTMGTAEISPLDLERMARGQIPGFRNIRIEREQLNRVRQTFRTIFGQDPNFRDADENLAWNTLMYRIRFPRDLSAEQAGIREFRRIFGQMPRDPFQWATVRVLGYIR